MPTWLIIVLVVLARPRRRRRHRPRAGSSRARGPRSSAASRRSTTTSRPPRRTTAAGIASTSRPPRAGSAPSSAAPSPTSSTLVEVIDRPGTDEDHAVFDIGQRSALTPRPPRRRLGRGAPLGAKPGTLVLAGGCGARAAVLDRLDDREHLVEVVGDLRATRRPRRDLAALEHRVGAASRPARSSSRARRARSGSGGSCRSGAGWRPRTARRACRSRRGRPRTPLA